MIMTFAKRVDRILGEAGHWKKWDGKEPIHMIIDPKSWPKYGEMDSSGRSKKRKRSKRIAGKL